MVRALTAVALAVAGGCAASRPDDSTVPPRDPEQRAVSIATTGCGLASDRQGSGVIVADGLVITAGHLIAEADRVEVMVADRRAVEADIVAVDLALDLALLRIGTSGITKVTTASAGVDGEGRIVAGATSGTVSFRVIDAVRLSIEEVLGRDRHRRLGYELEAATASGDSGSGAYDTQNRLIGIVFAVSAEGGSTWITASSEIEAFVAATESATDAPSCNPATSRLDIP